MRTPLRSLLARRPLPRPRRRPALSVCEHEIASTRVHPLLDGLRIGQLSDIHVRGGVRPRRLEHAIERMNALRPDVVVLTGDYVCVSSGPLPKLTEALRRLEIRAYATLGNHDHWSGAHKVRAALERAGVEVLQNEHRTLRFGAGELHLVGIDDSVTRHHDPEQAFAGVPLDATRIVLSHDPKSMDFLWKYHPALVLSGHTHGGQVYVRGLTPSLARRAGAKYLHGFFERDGGLLYVSRGLGASLPVRFRAPHEIAHLRLRTRRALSSAAPSVAA